MSWDAMLLTTNVGLELIQEEQADIYYKFKQNIRGGISSVMKRHAVADDNHSLIYLDANNLCGWMMSQPLPTGDFRILQRTDMDTVRNILNHQNMNTGYVFEVTLDYPENLQKYLSDLPPAPESKKTSIQSITMGKSTKPQRN